MSRRQSKVFGQKPLQKRSLVTIDETSIYEASYIGCSHMLERLLALSYIKAQISKPDEEWGFRTALHIAASKGTKFGLSD